MPESSLRQLVVFSLAGEEYALPISHVQEIIRYSEPRPVASQEAWVRGVISLRGRIVPVCDLAVRLGVRARRTPAASIIIVETEDGTVGMIVDRVDEVRSLTADELEPMPVAGAGFLHAIARIGERLVVVLDPARAFAGARAAA
jgi:purine-binding chemotaxis protein CheW